MMDEVLSGAQDIGSMNVYTKEELQTLQQETQLLGATEKIYKDEANWFVRRYLLPGKNGETPRLAQIYGMFKGIIDGKRSGELKIRNSIYNRLVRRYKGLLGGLRGLVDYFNYVYIPDQEREIEETKKNIPKMEEGVAQQKELGREYLKYRYIQ